MDESYSAVNISKVFPDWSAEDHAAKKKMWIGETSQIESKEFIADDIPERREVVYSPASLHCISEILVNALDRIEETKSFTGDSRTDHIWVTFNSDCQVTVKNNGRGVPVKMYPGKNKYLPEILFGQLFKGSNLEKTNESKTGGTNGVGSKLANLYSSLFEVEIVYKESDTKTNKIITKYYKQTWKNRMKNVSEPEVKDISESTKQYTKISFIPDFSLFDYPDDKVKIYKLLDGLLRVKIAQMACFANWISSGKAKIEYNGELFRYKSLQQFANWIYPDMKTFSVAIGTSTENKWEVCIGIHENDAKKKSDVLQMTCVNGVSVTGGKHVDKLLDQIIAVTKDNIAKILKETNINFQPGYVYNNIAIFMNCQIPGLDWTEQRKNKLEISAAKLKDYSLPDSFVKNISSNLQERIIETIYEKTPNIGLPKKTKKAIYIPKSKYTPAAYAGTAKSAQCMLFLTEGDSGKTMCDEGLGTLDSEQRRYYGTLTTRGAPVNALKASSFNKKTNRIQWGKKLRENEFLKMFFQVTNLNVDYSYDPADPNYKKQIKELKYGSIVLMVDADSDGMGKIAAIFISNMLLFWPKLVENGFVKIFMSPVRRAYPLGKAKNLKVEEFYSTYDFEQWVEKNNLSEEKLKSKYKIKYFKGLGTHTSVERKYMFKNLSKNIFTIYVERDTKDLYLKLYDKDSEPRKVILSKPIPRYTPEVILRQRETQKISASDHARYEAISHKFENLHQKLYDYVDGMNEVSRKILAGSIKYFKKYPNDEVKIDILSGRIISDMCYHHGPAPLQESIILKAFENVGGNPIIEFLPFGSFGDRQKGPAGHAQPRYIATKLNTRVTKLLYPPDDMPELEYNYDDGKKIEPRRFIPTLPTSILRSVRIPSDGWKGRYNARDVFSTSVIVKYLINCYEEKTGLDKLSIPNPPPDTTGFIGQIRDIRNKTYSVGKYEFDAEKRKLIIKELPLRVWYNDYITKLEEDRMYYNIKGEKSVTVKMFREIIPLCTKYTIHIEIYIEKPNEGYDPIDIIDSHADTPWTDGFEEYFLLKDFMDDHLNYVDIDKAVSFDSYSDIIRAWFPLRKEYYEKRVDRLLRVLEIEILYLENVIRYVSEYKTLGLNRIEEEVAINILSERKYVKFNKPNFTKIKKFPLAKLDEKIFKDGADYDYLLLTTDRDKLTKACNQREERLRRLKDEKNNLITLMSKGKFKGAMLWLNEIEQLQDVIKEGQRTHWMYDEFGKYKFE